MFDILRETLDKNRDKYIGYLTDLVMIDTSDIGHGIDGGKEKAGQDYMIELFKQMGAARVETDQLTEDTIQKSIKLHAEGNPGHNYEDRYNVYATFAGKSNNSLMFNGHIDIMPPTNLELWHHPPFSAIVEDGKVFGAGCCDMKAGLMASVMAVKLFQDAGLELPVDVIITSVVDEEGGGNGSIAAAMYGKKADGVVVCEPTNYELIVANMGFVFFEVDVKGLAIHSASKQLGVNAIEKAVKIMDAIQELEHKWLLTYKHHLLPPPSSNVGVIEGGSAGSTTADRCSFKTCVHYLPGQMTHERVVSEYTEAIMRCCEGDAWLRENKPEISIYQAGGANEIDLSAPIINSFKDAYRQVHGSEVVVAGSPAGCDSRIWQNIAECPTIQFGPGRMTECHAVNEYVEVKQYLDAILVYAQMILQWADATANKE
jgi:acetylornithine deacetylase